MAEELGYVWVSDKEYAMLLSKLRLKMGEILYPLRAYGQDVYVEGAIAECVELTEKFGEAVRGKEVNIATKRQLQQGDRLVKHPL